MKNWDACFGNYVCELNTLFTLRQDGHIPTAMLHVEAVLITIFLGTSYFRRSKCWFLSVELFLIIIPLRRTLIRNGHKRLRSAWDRPFCSLRRLPHFPHPSIIGPAILADHYTCLLFIFNRDKGFASTPTIRKTPHASYFSVRELYSWIDGLTVRTESDYLVTLPMVTHSSYWSNNTHTNINSGYSEFLNW